MQVTEDALRRRYASMDTETLVSIGRSSGLTPMAKSVLRDVLKSRGEDLASEAPINPYRQPQSNLIHKDRQTSMRTFFRVLVVGNSALFLFWFFVFPFVEQLFLSAETLDLLILSGYGSRIPYEYWVVHVNAFAWLAVFVGLYQFRRWARSAMLWLYCLSFVTGPFWGVVIHTALSGTISWLMTSIDGVILALCYFSSIADEFCPTRKNSDAE